MGVIISHIRTLSQNVICIRYEKFSSQYRPSLFLRLWRKRLRQLKLAFSLSTTETSEANGLYRVTMVVGDLGCVDIDLGCSIMLPGQ